LAFEASYFPPSERHSTPMRKLLLRVSNGPSCLVSDAVRNSEQEAARPCENVLARTGLSRSTIYRKIAEGTFPAQLKISTNGTGWHESEIN
jgi:predicted DNA-binding transcriptional regulator AlpA